jgi:hypothetical protein
MRLILFRTRQRKREDWKKKGESAKIFLAIANPVCYYIKAVLKRAENTSKEVLQQYGKMSVL